MGDSATVLTRRRLLQVPGVLLAGLAVGCRSGSTPLPGRPAVDSDEPVRARVRAAESRLLATYDATAARHPTLRSALRPLRAHHAAHLAAVSERPASTSASSAALPRTSVSAAPGPTSSRVEPFPADPGAAVRALVTAERAAARARAADCVSASRSLAGLLASIGACEAAHAAVLPGLTRRAAR